MLHRGGSMRGGRGLAPNRSRGRGSMGRGASSSSSSSSRANSPTPNLPNTANSYEQERNENAAKRALRQVSSTTGNGRGGRGGRGGQGRGNYVNKQVRFADSSDGENTKAFSGTESVSKPATSASGSNPFSSSAMSTSSTFGSSTPAAFNPFAPPKIDATAKSSNPFGTALPASNPFGAPSYIPSTSNSIFGGASQIQSAEHPKGVFGAKSTSDPSSVFGAPSKAHTSGSSTSVFGAPSTNISSNPFGGVSSIAGGFGAPSTTNLNPFGVKPNGIATPSPDSKPIGNVFGRPSTSLPNPFASTAPKANGAAPGSSTSKPASSMFGTPSTSNPFPPNKLAEAAFPGRSPPTSVFGAPSTPLAVPKSNGVGGAFPPSQSTTSQSTSNPFSAPIKKHASSSPAVTPRGTSGFPSAPKSMPKNISSNKTGPTTTPSWTQTSSSAFSKPASGNFGTPRVISESKSNNNSHGASNGSRIALSEKIDEVLKRKRIIKPKWPAVDLESFQRNAADFPIAKYRLDLMEYREKVRNALVKANLFDEPGVARKLEDAIEFKGTCEDMCPEFEIAERIVEGRSDNAEKVVLPDGSLSRFPTPEKMVKVLARSSAGQETPLPSDVRSAAALRRTVDYLLQEMLATNELRAVHNFIWDRSRAVRRDFVFHSSMTPPELLDQVYCLELITRFHVTTLHLMAKEPDLSAAEYVEQQECEQLGKTLLSLIHAYEDCKSQGVVCENEAEFRAYYILFHDEDSGILEAVQGWGWKFWGESEDVQTAVALVEMLQNVWQPIGPFQPPSETDVAQNAFSRFFSIIEDKSTSYTMACFAEMKFNKVRETIMRTILASYRRQKDQTKDWTLSKLNAYLRFDDDAEVFTFCQARGLQIEEANGEEYLSFDLGEMTELPKDKQIHSYALVERKRGHHSLPELISSTLFEEAGQDNKIEDEEEEGLFVKDDSGSALPAPARITFSNAPQEVSNKIGLDETRQPTLSQPTPVPDSLPKPASLFDRIATPPIPSTSLFSSKPAEISTSLEAAELASTSVFANNITQEASSIFTPSSFQKSSNADSQASSPFSFLKPSPKESTKPTETTPTFGNSTVKEVSKGKPENAFFSALQSSSAPVPTGISSASDATQKHQQVQSPQSPSLAASQTSVPATKNAINNSLQTQPDDKTPLTSSSPTPSLGHSPPISTETVGNALPKPSLDWTQYPVPKPLFGVTPAPVERSARLDGVANWYTLGEDGLLEHFTTFQIEQILHEAMRKFEEERAQQAAFEAEKAARAKKQETRYFELAMKYFPLWQKLARRKGLRRRGREARKARLELAESMRASKVAQSANIVEDLKASVRNKRRTSLESLLDATGVLNGVHNPGNELQTISQPRISDPAPKRRRAQTSSRSQSTTSSRHKYGKSENPLRRSLFSDPSYLSGESRIHLIKDYASLDSRPQASGVQTDYFRLKARGIVTLPDGTALATSAAKSLLRHKSSLDSIRSQMSPPPRPLKLQPPARSVPATSTTRTERPRSSAEREEEIQALKARAKEMMAAESNMSRQKRSFTDDEDEDEELFARAKRVREQMDEGAEWFRQERERRSIS